MGILSLLERGSTMHRSHNMVFTQGPLSVGESLGCERRNASVTFFSDGDSGTPSLFVQAANPWYDIRYTYIVRFVADGCRKNLPLCDSAFWTTTHTNPQQTAALPMLRLPVRPLQRGRSGCLSSSVYRPSVAIYCSRPRALRIHSSTLGLRCFFSH